GRVVAGRGDVGDRVVDVLRGARHVVRRERRRDHLQQALGGDAVLGVDVPEVDRLRVAGGLPHDVAVDALVGAGDAVLLHDVEGLTRPAVEVVGVALGGRRLLHLGAVGGAAGALLGLTGLLRLLRGGGSGGLLLGGGLGLRLGRGLLLRRDLLGLDAGARELVGDARPDVLDLLGAVGHLGRRSSCLARDGRRRVARHRRDPDGGGTEGGDTGSGDLVMTGQGATVTTGEDVLRHGG